SFHIGMPPEEAMTATESCPDPRDLELLLLGHLAGPEAETLERHVLGCDSCVQRLRGQGSGDRLLKALRGQATDPRQTPDTSVEALMKHLQEKSLPWRSRSRCRRGTAAPEGPIQRSLRRKCIPSWGRRGPRGNWVGWAAIGCSRSWGPAAWASSWKP